MLARAPFVRALGSVSLWRLVQRGEQPLDVFVEAIASFCAIDRAWCLSRAIYEVRVRANQSRRRQQQAAPVFQREEVIRAFLRAFEDAGRPESVAQFIPSLSGPINGSWAQSTNDDVLLPLVERGFIEASSLLTLWTSVLNEKVLPKESHFFPSTDVELLDVWAQAYWRASDQQRAEVLVESEKEIAKAQRTLDEPFLSSRDHSRWRTAADALIWWLLRWAALISRSPGEAARASIEKVGAIAFQAVSEHDLVDSAVGEFKEAGARALTYLRAELAPRWSVRIHRGSGGNPG